jgi:hypothetical protein
MPGVLRLVFVLPFVRGTGAKPEGVLRWVRQMAGGLLHEGEEAETRL